LNRMLSSEINILQNGMSIGFGGSCIVAARKK